MDSVFTSATPGTASSSIFGTEGSEGCFPSLSYTTRMYGFAACFVIGVLLSVMSTLSIFKAITDPTEFVALYTMGNVVGLIGTGFLFGPIAQCKRMFEETRRWATIIYIGTLVLTIVVACAIPFPENGQFGKGILILLLMVIQWMALLWYCASFMPGGRTMLQTCAKGSLGMCCPV